MEITEVGVRIVERSEDRLKAVCTMTIDDCFVVRDIKVVEGQHGLFVAMPSRKRTSRCPQCGHKNEIRARFCGECSAKQPPPPPARPQNGEKTTSHTDIAHPINTECREMIQEVILEAYQEELAEYLAEQGQEGAAGAVESEETACAGACACSGHESEFGFEADGDERMEAPLVEMEAPKAQFAQARTEPAGPRQNDRPQRRDAQPRRDVDQRRDSEQPRRDSETRRDSEPRRERSRETVPQGRETSRDDQRQDSRPPRSEPAPQKPAPPARPEREPAPVRAPQPVPVADSSDEGFGAGIL